MASIKTRQTVKGPRYDVRYRLPSGAVRTRTFLREKEARIHAATVEADKARGGLVDPRSGRVTLAGYAAPWLADRPGLRPRTREMYASMLEVHVLPTFGETALADITPAAVRRWHSQLAAGPSPTMAPKAYRLLRSILSTAVDDDVLVKNPARVKGGGQERTPERTMASLPQVYALADAVGDRYRALALTAGLAGLRWGEVTALTRRRVDLLHGTVTVTEQRVRLDSGETITSGPKTDAGRRIVAIPQPLVAELEEHLARFVPADPDALIFTAPGGGPLDRTNFRERVWAPACRAVRVDITFHDLRHTAATLAAISGATTKELMARLGHSSQQAALIYQHATADRDAAIADALTGMVTAAGLAPVVALPRDGRAMEAG